MNKKLTIIVCIILVLGLISASIGIGYYYGVYEKNIQKETHNIFYDYYVAKVAQFKEENKTLGEVDVAFLGDSLTDGYPVQNWYPQYNVVNRGIGADSTWGLEERLDCSAYDVNPKVIVMLIGINNLDTMLQNYERIVQKIKQNLPSTKIIIESITPESGDFAFRNPQAITNNIELKKIAERNGCTYIDMYSELLDPNTNELKLEYTIEGLHFTDQGYKKITGVLTPVIASLLGF
ncbi:MAG: hypothetical protein J5656_06125 [Clostridia bacterium]|nr:hypothetical protein [Clostridia bacterium]